MICSLGNLKYFSMQSNALQDITRVAVEAPTPFTTQVSFSEVIRSKRSPENHDNIFLKTLKKTQNAVSLQFWTGEPTLPFFN